MKRIFIVLSVIILVAACGSQYSVKHQTEKAVDDIAWKIASKIDSKTMVIAVADLVPEQKTEKLKGIAKTISEMLVTKLHDKGIKVVENAQLNQLVQEKKLALAGIVDSDTAAKVGQMTGAGYILLGSISMVKDEVFINARLVDIATRVVISAAEASMNLAELEKKEPPKKAEPIDPSVLKNTPTSLIWFSWANLMLNYPVLAGAELLDFNVVFFSPVYHLGIGFGFSIAKAYLTDMWFVPNLNGAGAMASLFPLKLLFPIYINPDQYNRTDVYLKAEVGGIMFNEGPDRGDTDGDEYLDVSVDFRSKFKLGGVSMPLAVSLGFLYSSHKVSYNFDSQWTIYAQFSLGIGGYSSTTAMSE
jgi:TolB-like protein